MLEIDLGKVGITPAGNWGNKVNYEKLTAVTWKGRSYLSKIANKGVEPGTNSDVWQLLAEKGADGEGGGGGGGEGTTTDIGVERFTDGLLYWTKNGTWLLDEYGQKVRAQGLDGKDGKDGEGGGGSGDGESAFKSIIFLRSPSTPPLPQGGTFERPVASGWFDGIPSGESILWMSTRWFYSDANKTALTSWSAPVQATDTADIDLEFSSIATVTDPSRDPSNYWHNDGRENDIWMAVRKKSNGVWGNWSVVKIKGEDGAPGEPGADGSSIHILGSLESDSLLPDDGTQTSGDCYLIDGDLWVWDGDSWVNVGEIQGPAGESSYIFVAYSDDGGLTLTTNYGTDPGLYMGYAIVSVNTRPTTASAYSNWARFKGEDGFGYEYIYKATTDDTAPNIPESSNVDEYVPEGWSDDPIGVDASYPYCWVCQRKKTNGIWGAYTGNPDTNKAALWAKWGADGTDGISPNTAYKSIVFKRTNTTPSAPDASSGSYASPVPTGWSDGVPAGSEMLWMSTRIFSSDGEAPQQAAWTTPQAVTDTEYMDYMFSDEESPATPNKSTPSGSDSTGDWGESADSSTIWMAMRPIANGAYVTGSTWNMIKVKGEDGQDGRSVIIKGHVSTSSQLPVSGNTAGDAYTVGTGTTNNLYVWDGDSWENAGRFNGTDGTSSYIHIKYSNDNGAHFTSNNGETPGDYIGIYVDGNATDSSSVSAYQWKLIKGDDGFGYEYIYKLTNTSTAPSVPGTSQQTDGDVPTGWSDDPQDVSSSNPYLWVCYRKKTDGTWGSWIGSATDNTKAALFSHYGQNGTNGTNGRNGTDGNNGKTVRGPGDWETGKSYQGSENIYAEFVDFVYYNGDYNTLYYCKISHTSSSSINPTNTTYWGVAPMKEIIATKLFYAQLGFVNNLGVNILKVQNGNSGSIYGGMMPPDTDYASNKNNGNTIFWVGGATPDDQNTAFKVDSSGNGTFAGVVRATALYKSLVRYSKSTNSSTTYLDGGCPDIIVVKVFKDTIGTNANIVLPTASSAEGRILTFYVKAASNTELAVLARSGESIEDISGSFSADSISLTGSSRVDLYSDGSDWVRLN